MRRKDYYDYRKENRDYRKDYEEYNPHTPPKERRVGSNPQEHTTHMVDYAKENRYMEEMDKWCEKLERYDRFDMPKREIIRTAEEMGVHFEEYDEDDFLCVYYMLMSDFPKITNEPHTYLAMAKDWLEDEDAKLKGEEKLIAYFCHIVKGE